VIPHVVYPGKYSNIPLHAPLSHITRILKSST